MSELQDVSRRGGRRKRALSAEEKLQIFRNPSVEHDRPRLCAHRDNKCYGTVDCNYSAVEMSLPAVVPTSPTRAASRAPVRRGWSVDCYVEVSVDVGEA